MASENRPRAPFSRTKCECNLSLLHCYWETVLKRKRFIHSTVAFRLGEVQDPHAKLYMILYGREGESGKIYLAPSDGKKFEPGRLYTVSANIRDIGPVGR